MIETYKAQRRLIKLGDIELTVFQLPDGSYRLSQTEVSGVIDKDHRSIGRFLLSKRLKTLSGKASRLGKLAVEGSNKPITPIPLELAALYWQHWDNEGNPIATALVNALLKRTLKDIADEAFGIQTSTEERDRQLKADLSEESIARITALQQQLQQQLDSSQDQTQFQQYLQLQMQQLMLQVQNLQLQVTQLQQAPKANKFSTFIAIESANDMKRVCGVTHLELRSELGIETVEEMNRLLAEAGVDVTSGYWQFAKAITPVLPYENYQKVMALLKERLNRGSEFRSSGYSLSSRSSVTATCTYSGKNNE